MHAAVAAAAAGQIKVLRTLQYFPPPEGVAAQKQLHDVLQAIFNGKTHRVLTHSAASAITCTPRDRMHAHMLTHNNTSRQRSAMPRARRPLPERPHRTAACGEPSKPSMINKSNAQHGILFEAIALILALDFSRDLLAASVAALARFLSVKVRAAL